MVLLCTGFLLLLLVSHLVKQLCKSVVVLSCAGFLQQFAGVCRADEPEKNMATVLEQLSNGQTPTRVLCCGHSLGGALATLGAHSAQTQHLDYCIWSTV